MGLVSASCVKPCTTGGISGPSLGLPHLLWEEGDDWQSLAGISCCCPVNASLKAGVVRWAGPHGVVVSEMRGWLLRAGFVVNLGQRVGCTSNSELLIYKVCYRNISGGLINFSVKLSLVIEKHKTRG